ncbi:MAG TPA: tetratricopeptide repeat protein, partial [Solirubrobacteraceae bacterium]|nr:tetratricopeptide repeat protein [Solirubrobacteraceae bacterium]
MSLDALTAPAIASLIALAAAVVALVRLYVNSRRSIVFDAWVDFAKQEGEGDRGKSLADLLLFHIREIQNAHQRSGRPLDLTNPYDDIPAFQQELDANLMAAVELQRETRFVGSVVSLLLAIMPIRPGRLRGSIHRFGDELRVNVVLEHARGRRGTAAPQWTASRTAAEQLPDLIEELAYEIYLGLAQNAVFADAVAFRTYTEALEAHLRYGDLSEDRDRVKAERLYRKAIKLEPRNPAAHYNLGVLHYYMFETERNQQAEKAFRAAMPAARGALRAQVHSGLANVYSTQYHRFKSNDEADLEKAIFHAHEALRLDDGLDVVLKAAAYAHQQTGQATKDDKKAAEHRRKAVRYYRKAIAANPRYYTAHNNLGNLYLVLAQRCEDGRVKRALLDAAVALFKETMTIRPAYQHAYDNVGNAYYELAFLDEKQRFRLEHAARYFQDALNLVEDYPEALNDLAMLHLTPEWKDRKPDEAPVLHRKALEACRDQKRQPALAAAYAAREKAVATGTTVREPGRAVRGATALAVRA